MAKSRSKVSRIALYVVLGICILAMAGFGLGSVFAPSTSASVAIVGEEKVDADEYFRRFQNEISSASQRFGTNISIDQAIAVGLDRTVLQRLIQEAAFRGEANRMELSVSDETVRDILVATRGFQGLDGNFDPVGYEEALRRSGMTSAEYEDLLRSDSSQQIVIDTVVAGVELSEEATNPLFEYLGENRAFNYVLLSEADIIGTVPAPTPAQLETYYSANPEMFTTPLTRQITYAAAIPAELADNIEVAPEDVQSLYDDRADEYSTAEKRFVERIVFGTLEEANDAVARVVSEELTFEAIAEERGLNVAALDIGEVTRGDLSKEAADLLFETSNPGIYGPAIDDLGPAIYRVNAAIEAQTVPLDDVYAELEREIAMDEALALILDGYDRVLDLIAGGAAPEDLAEETNFTLNTLDWEIGNTEGIAAYSAFRTEAQSAEIGEARDIVELADGGMVLVRVDAVIEPELQSMETVNEELVAAVVAQNTQDKIRERGMQIQTAISSSGGSLVDFANNLNLEFVGDVARTSNLPDLPATTVDTIYDMNTGETSLLDTPDGVVLVELWSITPFDPTTEESMAAVEAVSGERDTQLAQDVLVYFGRALVDQAQPTVNQSRIETLHLQLR